MEQIYENYYEYCDSFRTIHKFSSPSLKYFVCSDAFRCEAYNFAPQIMDIFDKRSSITIKHVWQIMLTILLIPISFALGSVFVNVCPRIKCLHARFDNLLRYVVQFIVIIVPNILSVNIAHPYIEYITPVIWLLAFCFAVLYGCLSKVSDRQFILGRRPSVLTLIRSALNVQTAICILAIDFNNFPRDFRKTRRYGAGLMDMGIGTFVFVMGIVARRPTRKSDVSHMLRMVLPLMLLGLIRTLVIITIDYHQDEHEYGKHLNAFFTLGLSKLFGASISAVAKTDFQLLLLGIGVASLHEIGLQCGISDFVMARWNPRDTFFKANREGLCSLPGFISIYLIAMYTGRHLQEKHTLTYTQFRQKVINISVVAAICWIITAIGIFTLGVARVTCNFTYVVWMVSIVLTMIVAFMIIFDLIINTIWPTGISVSNANADVENVEVANQTKLINGSAGESGDFLKLSAKSMANTNQSLTNIPPIIEAINYNGLSFFLLANVLTGAVNIFLDPDSRSNLESLLILTIYMLMTIEFVYILYRFKIRIT